MIFHEQYLTYIQAIPAAKEKNADFEMRKRAILERLEMIRRNVDKTKLQQEAEPGIAQPPVSIPEKAIPTISDAAKTLEEEIFTLAQSDGDCNAMIKKMKLLQKLEIPSPTTSDTTKILQQMAEIEAIENQAQTVQSRIQKRKQTLHTLKSTFDHVLHVWMEAVRQSKAPAEDALLKKAREMESKVMSDLSMKELTGFSTLQKEEQKRFIASHPLDDSPIPLAVLDICCGAERFQYPLSFDADMPLFICCDAKAEESGLRDFFNLLVMQTLLHTRGGKLEIMVSDGYWMSDFTKKVAGQLGRPAPDGHTICKYYPDASNTEEFSAQLKNCRKLLKEAVDTLAASGLTFDQYNHTDSLPGIPRRLLLVNGLEKFIGHSYSSNDANLKLLGEIADHARKCGILIVCVGTEAAWNAYVTQNPESLFEKITLQKNQLGLDVKMDAPGITVASTATLLPHEETLLPDWIALLRKATEFSSDGNIDFMKMIPAIPFQESSASIVRAPFAKDTLGNIVFWQCSSNSEPGQTLLIGGTGSGKSNLMHAVITSCCYRYSPADVQLYLIDLKEGLEFKIYHDYHLPHARLIATEGDREMALGCLRNIWTFYEERSASLKHAGVENMTAYRETGKDMARIVLLIDEFQVLFQEHDKIADEAENTLNNLITKGRAAGIHVFLSTQNPSGIPQRIIKNVTTKIVMRCESDIIGQIFPSGMQLSKQLSRIGEGFFASMENKNTPILFRAAYMDKEMQKKLLNTISGAATSLTVDYETVLYDGAAFPQASTHIRDILASGRENALGLNVLCGESENLTDPVICRLLPDFGENLLIAGKHGNSTEVETCSAVFYQSLAENLRSISDLSISIYDRNGYFDSVTSAECCADIKQLGNKILTLHRLLRERESGNDKTQDNRLLILTDAHRLNGLAQIQESSGSAAPQKSGLIPLVPALPKSESSNKNALTALQALLSSGAANHIFVLIASNNLRMLIQNFFDGRSGELKNFNHRIVFQTSESDSSILLNNPSGSKLGAHHALYCNVNESRIQRFRPYKIN